jgi:hypothetical protein
MFGADIIRKRLKPMDFRLTEDLLQRLCEIWPNPETGSPGIRQKDLARFTGLTTGAVSNYFNGRIPDDKARDTLSEFFGIVYFSNNPNIDNEAQLNRLKAFFERFVYRSKAIA